MTPFVWAVSMRPCHPDAIVTLELAASIMANDAGLSPEQCEFVCRHAVAAERADQKVWLDTWALWNVRRFKARLTGEEA